MKKHFEVVSDKNCDLSKLHQYNLDVVFFRSGAAVATICFGGNNNFSAEGFGDSQESAAIDATAKLFGFVRKEAPHLLNEDALP